MGVGYQKFQAGSPDSYLDFGVISTLALHLTGRGLAPLHF